MEQSIKDRFIDEMSTIYDYTSYIENNFYVSSKRLLQDENDKFKVLNDYDFYANTQAGKEKNRRVIREIKEIIDFKIFDIGNKLFQIEKTTYDKEAESIKKAEDDLERSLEYFENLQTLYNLYDESNHVNIYRQSFILCMTAFDALVPDLACEILSQNIVEGKYASTIVKKLYQYNTELFTVNGQDEYESIVEMIQRRNIHVHKKGIVDEKYFSKVNGKKFGLQIGDYAAIDCEYFLNSCEILREFVSNLDEIIPR